VLKLGLCPGRGTTEQIYSMFSKSWKYAKVFSTWLVDHRKAVIVFLERNSRESFVGVRRILQHAIGSLYCRAELKPRSGNQKDLVISTNFQNDSKRLRSTGAFLTAQQLLSNSVVLNLEERGLTRCTTWEVKAFGGAVVPPAPPPPTPVSVFINLHRSDCVFVLCGLRVCYKTLK